MSDAAPTTFTVAVAGNPNAGKTTLFNMLTGSNQTVGNYPGVTVEKKSGTVRTERCQLHIVDLPGTYSLTAYSQEEVVARDFIIDDKPDAVVSFLDASNLERNLYLALQLTEMGVPLVVALNMHDIAEQRGIHIDTTELSSLLGVPVVITVGHRGQGRRELLAVLERLLLDGEKPTPHSPVYGPELEPTVKELAKAILADAGLADRVPPRWLAVKLLEREDRGRSRVLREADAPTGLLALADRLAERVEKRHSEDPSTLVAEHRYGHAAGIVRDCVTVHDQGRSLTDAIDTIVCHRGLGFLFVGLVIFVTFKLTFLLADGIHWIPWVGGWRSPVGVSAWFFEEWLPTLVAGMADGPLKSMLLDGVIAGVGGVMGFVPLIFVMFLMLGIIEDSGYIARIAFVLDRVLRAFGLQGKSILAMIVSGGIAGGCAVPGVLATRTLREEKDRLVTMLVVPFMNCGAKMPVFAVLIAAFFAKYKGEMLWLLALLSWVFALFAALILRRFVIKGEQTPFVMELPPYHVPTVRNVLLISLERSWMYLKKAGTVILAVSIVLWAMMFFPHQDTGRFDAQRAELTARLDEAPPDQAEAIKRQLASLDGEQRQEQVRNSFAGRFGRSLEPISMAAGLTWRENISLLGGFAAKEVIVSTMGMAYSLGDVEAQDDVSEDMPLVTALRADTSWNPLRAFALIVFVMLYAPCLVTVAAIWRESGSWKWAAFSVVYSTVIAFFMATFVYRAGLLLGAGA
jgi:ferrous iron transport protein B